jgi:dUTP pyrophosphatase
MAQTVKVSVSMAELRNKLTDPNSLKELIELAGEELAQQVQAVVRQNAARDEAAKSLGAKITAPAGKVHEAAGTARPVAAVRTAVIKGHNPTLKFKRLHEDAVIPSRSHPSDAGFDLTAALGLGSVVTIRPGQRQLVNTGVAVAIPDGFVGLVAPRSGLAVKHGISVTNAPGIVDAGYRGELKVIVHNLGSEDFEIRHGDRIAQLVITPFLNWQSEETAELPEADRGAAGFGSTGR